MRASGVASALATACSLVLVASLAGCFASDDAPLARTSGTAEPEKGTSSVTGNASDPAKTTPAPKPSGGRWHFHNMWEGATELVLLNETLVLSAQGAHLGVPGDVRVGGTAFGFPAGTLVPPETGTLTIAVAFTPATGVPYTGLTLFAKAANENERRPVGELTDAARFEIAVSENMTDVPHQGASMWRFRLDPTLDENGVGIANGTARVTITATIGRPVLIDPPHGDPWALGDTLPLANASDDAAFARFSGLYARTTDGETTFKSYLLEAAAGNASRVPEGARDVLIRLEWASAVPTDAGAFIVMYAEGNTPSEGPLAPEAVGEGFATYRIPLTGSMVDSPYARASTWTLRVDVEETRAGYVGAIALKSWVTRLSDVDAGTLV